MYYHLQFLDPVYIEDSITDFRRGTGIPDVGQIIAWRDPRTLVARPWRVIERQPMENEDEGTRVRLRDPAADPDPLSGQGEEMALRWGAKRELASSEGPPSKITDLAPVSTTLLGEDYPIGAQSGQLLPTAETLWAKIAAAEREELDRFSMPGFCPACGEPITQRQHRQEFPANLVIPGGPTVIFHVREKCWTIGGRYQKAYYGGNANNSENACDNA